MTHVPVLLDEILEGLDIRPDDVVIDMTLGDGGHAEAFGKLLSKDGTLIGIDQDKDVLFRVRDRLKHCRPLLYIENTNFRHIKTILNKHNIPNISKALFDLGLRTGHLVDSNRGFTFKRDEPLYMTMAHPTDESLTAEVIVNEWEEDSIADVLYGYGEEHYSRRIARTIVESRAEHPIRTTHELVDIILRSVPESYKRKKIHPATKTFQALRIAVNDELGAFTEALEDTFTYLAHDGRIAVISYHSLEDRIAKRFFRDKMKEGVAEVLTKKPIVPTQSEQSVNPKSRSAKLRILKKI